MLTAEEVENWNAGVKQTAFQPPPGWIYPRGYVAPAPAPPGYRLRVEYDGFLGLEVRWRYERGSRGGDTVCRAVQRYAFG